MVGSSPRAWGIPNICGIDVKSIRFIPTCVGNTHAASLIPELPPVHPHVRGEYYAFRSLPGPCGGSSPRAWGIRGKKRQDVTQARFIPTCVGNTRSREYAEKNYPVHPHVRGEYQISTLQKDVNSGSSPRAWGIRWELVEPLYDERFIPTCVGNTQQGCKVSARPTVHPHVRGEYSHKAADGLVFDGSSPRAWGIPQMPSPPNSKRRFIPTCVGNTAATAV